MNVCCRTTGKVLAGAGESKFIGLFFRLSGPDIVVKYHWKIPLSSESLSPFWFGSALKQEG